MYRDNAKAVEDYAAVARYENVFPELRESEDEMIRQKLLECCDSPTFEIQTGIKNGMLKSWLEKQKELLTPEEKMNHPLYLEGFDVGRKVGQVEAEQKPIPDWMPKFLDELRSKKNYFDWDEHRDIEGRILAIINYIAPNYFEEKEQKPVELNKLDDGEKGYYATLLEKFKEAVYDCAWGKVTCNPAETKKEYADRWAEHLLTLVREFSDDYIDSQLRFEREQAYEHGKEDAKAEQKLTWSEEDEKMLHIIFTDINYAQKNYSTSKLTPYDKKVSWLKALSLNLKKKNEDVTKLCSNEWSKEEKACLNEAIETLNKLGYNGIADNLKHLRPQPKQEWNEEDVDAFVKSYSDSLPMCGEFQSYHEALVHAYRQGVVNTLKSFRPSWKPSRAQMSMLFAVINEPNNASSQSCHLALVELYQELQKL